MFKSRYWREYPVFLQAILLMLMFFSLGSFFIVAAKLLIPTLTGVAVQDLLTFGDNSGQPVRDAYGIFMAFNTIGSFLAPALLFAYLTHPRPGKYLGLRAPGKSIHWPLVIVIGLSALPLILGLQVLVKNIDFGAAIQRAQAQDEARIKALLDVHTTIDFVKIFLITAILPPLAEEFMFRGIVMRLLHKRSKRIGVSIALTALIFAALHANNPYGIASIFLAALVLGAVYYLTGSIWMSILMHVIINGTQVVASYMATNNPAFRAFAEQEAVPWPIIAVGAVLFTTSLYLLWKNRTPLADNWSDDFTAAELIDREA